MRQQTLASQAGFEKYGRKTRREQFLEEMEQVVPWAELERLIRPRYPKAGERTTAGGAERDAAGVLSAQWFNLSDPGAEEL